MGALCNSCDIHDVLYCDVFVGRLGWQIIRAIIASVITPGLFHESRQVLSRDADYDSLLGIVNTKRALGKRLTSVGQVLA